MQSRATNTSDLDDWLPYFGVVGGAILFLWLWFSDSTNIFVISVGLIVSSASLYWAVIDNLSLRFIQQAEWEGVIGWITVFGQMDRHSLNRHHTHPLQIICAVPGLVAKDVMSECRRYGHATRSFDNPMGTSRLTAKNLGFFRVAWRLTYDLGQDPPELTSSSIPVVSVGNAEQILAANDASREIFGSNLVSVSDLKVGGRLEDGEIVKIGDGSSARAARLLVNRALTGQTTYMFMPVVEPNVSTMDFDTLPVPILRILPSGVIVQSNVQARSLLKLDAIDGSSLADLMEGQGKTVEDWISTVATGDSLVLSEFFRMTDQKPNNFIHATLLRVDDHGSIELVALLNDATALKNLEAGFIQGQKMQAIGQLAGGIAHDFNNLLTAIAGHCDLLLLRHDHGDPEYPDLIQIHQNSNRAASLVSQLLAFSRKQAFKPQMFDLRYIMSDLTHLLNRLVGEKVQLEFDHQLYLSEIQADRRQLEQVLINLVVNARDAMPKGGNVVIRTRNITIEAPKKRNGLKIPPGKYVRIEVEDQGEGIDPEFEQKIFDPFFTTKNTGDGVGLGLSTVYGIIKQSDAFIYAKNREEGGAVFTILFPAKNRPNTFEEAKPKLKPRPVASTKGQLVLLVEDEAPVRSFASRALKLGGFKILEADTAEAALELLENKDLHVDLVVSDVVMPGLDGPSWIRKAQDKRPNLKVIFVSGYPKDAFTEEQPEVTNSTFLQKPFSLNELIEAVKKQCD